MANNQTQGLIKMHSKRKQIKLLMAQLNKSRKTQNIDKLIKLKVIDSQIKFKIRLRTTVKSNTRTMILSQVPRYILKAVAKIQSVLCLTNKNMTYSCVMLNTSACSL